MTLRTKEKEDVFVAALEKAWFDGYHVGRGDEHTLHNDTADTPDDGPSQPPSRLGFLKFYNDAIMESV